MKQALKYGAFDFISKPHFEKLMETVAPLMLLQMTRKIFPIRSKTSSKLIWLEKRWRALRPNRLQNSEYFFILKKGAQRVLGRKLLPQHDIGEMIGRANDLCQGINLGARES